MSQQDAAPGGREIAADLTRARQRGLSNLNLERGDQHPVSLPALEALAYRYSDVTQGDRIALIRGLLSDALDAYSEGRPDDSKFVRDLYFDSEGRSPGPGGPGGLLDAARRYEAEDRFRRRQRTQLQDFAAFLRIFVPWPNREDEVIEAEGTASPTQRRLGRVHSRWRHRAVVSIFVVGAAVAGAASVTALNAHRHALSKPRGPQTTLASQLPSTSTPDGPVRFRFDTHGDPPFTVLVYPGPLDTALDKTSNAEFPNGATVNPVCITIGRQITFYPNAGGARITDNRWVQIDAGTDSAKFATLTYGELIPPRSRLPTCAHVS